VHSIIAELSVSPIGSKSPSVGKQVGEALKAIKKVKGIRFEVNPMGTVIESTSIDAIFKAAKAAEGAIFKLGESRVQTILKIDDRRDKMRSMESKVESVKKFL
jgi:uncharacterized protein (TIGR00106 family)